MVERTMRFTVPTTEAILPANLFKAGMAASIAAAAATAHAAPMAIAAAVAERDDQFILDFTREAAPAASSPLKHAIASGSADEQVIDVTAEDVADDEFGVIDLNSDPSSDDVVATARRFARQPAE
jgi:tRNA-dihydrouridine synthase